jgi:hypothetical protein
MWQNDRTILTPLTITCMMSFHSSQCRQCSEFKFLGMNITAHLKWYIHIWSLCASLSKVYYIIKSFKDVMSFHMIWTIYYAYFESQMKYGIIFWGRGRDSAKVFQIQKKVICLISVVNTCDSCRHTIMEYRILTVASLYILEVLCFIKKNSKVI